MHPTLTFDLIRADHAERLEAARLSRRREARPADGTRGRPPEPRRAQPALRTLLAGTTPVAGIR
jgi:hypothetical protein